MMKKSLKVPETAKDLPQAIVKQMLSLATSGFGLVAALAWNEFVKESINTYIKPYFPEDSRILTLFFYAVIVTALAVLVTLQLTKLEKFLQNKINFEAQKPSSS